MELLGDLWAELWAVLVTLFQAAPYIVGYVLLILLMMVIWTGVQRILTPKKDYGSLKTVTFGDESAVTSNTAASVVSIKGSLPCATSAGTAWKIFATPTP